jgi:hypothetical protein
MTQVLVGELWWNGVVQSQPVNIKRSNDHVMVFEPLYGMGLKCMGIYMKPSAFYIHNQNI